MIPIVLHHGLFGFDEFRFGRLRISYFHRIDRFLADLGHPLITTRVHPTGSVVHRARQLKETILRQLDILGRRDSRVVILAHSLGGLDGRHMISRLGMADRVAALVTICTPHRGSSYADWCVQHLGRRLGGLNLMNFLRIEVQAIGDLTRDACRVFNETTPDSPHVYYASVAGARPTGHLPPMFIHSHKVITDAEGENDGMVSVGSARWGKDLGVWPVDHLHAVGRRLVPAYVSPIADMTPFYGQILQHLRVNGILDGKQG